MNRKLVALILLAVWAGSLLLPPSPAAAAASNGGGQTPTVPATAPSAPVQPSSGSEPPSSEPSDPGMKTENLFPYSQDLVVQGVTNRQDFYFEMTPSRILHDGSYLELVFSHSQTLLPKKSTLTILLDDEPLGSIFLNASNEKKTSWRADLSDRELKPGFHKLSILSHMEASTNLCDDQNNPANWLILHQDSLVHLQLKQAYERADFAYYPSPFLEKGGLKPLQTLFVVPDSANAAQLKALGELAAFFSSEVPANMLSFQAFKESDVTGDLRKANMIWIGRKDQWKTLGAQLTDGVSDGKIHLAGSPWNSKASILSVNGTDAQIGSAVRTLVTPELYGQLSGQDYDISSPRSPVQVQQGSAKGASDTSLQDLGFGDLIVDSPIVGTARITYNLPTEIDINKTGHFKMHFKHAKTLNFTQSLVTVKVNGVPVKSRFLNEESSDLGVLDVEITPELMANRNVVVDVSFQFSSAQGACTGSTQIGNWAVISKQSTFSFETRPNGSMLLEEIPYPFVIRQQWTDTEFVLPASPSSEELSLYATVCAAIGKNAVYGSENGDTFQVSFADAGLSKHAADKNLIYIGSIDRIPKAVAESAEFPVRWKNGELTPANGGIELLPRSGSGFLMVMAASPYAEGKQVLVVAGTGKEAMKQANEQMSDPNVRAAIAGKSAFIDELNRVHTIQAAAPVTERTSFSEKASSMLNVLDNPVYTRFLFVGAFALVLGIIGVLLWLTRKRNR